MNTFVLLKQTTYGFLDTMNELTLFSNYQDLLKFVCTETIDEINERYIEIDDEVINELGEEYLFITENKKIAFKSLPEIEEIQIINEILQKIFQVYDSYETYRYESYACVYGNNVKIRDY